MCKLPRNVVRQSWRINVEEQTVLISLVGVEEHEPVGADGALLQSIAHPGPGLQRRRGPEAQRAPRGLRVSVQIEHDKPMPFLFLLALDIFIRDK